MSEVNQNAMVNNALVLSNAIELACAVVEKLAGNDVSTHYRGEEMRSSEIADAAAARIQTRFSRFMETA